MKTYLYNLKSTITFLASVSKRKSIFRRPLKTVVSCNLFIMSECGSTLYVGLAHTAPPYKLPGNFSTNPTSGGSL